jgi:hypothetical protein
MTPRYNWRPSTALCLGKSSRGTHMDVRIVAWAPHGNEQEQAINTALGDRIAATFCRTEEELWVELDRPNVRVFVLDLATSKCPDAAELVAAARGRFPAIRIVGLGGVGKSRSVEILACVRAGMDALALRGYCDLEATITGVLAECDRAEQVVDRRRSNTRGIA